MCRHLCTVSHIVQISFCRQSDMFSYLCADSCYSHSVQTTVHARTYLYRFCRKVFSEVFRHTGQKAEQIVLAYISHYSGRDTAIIVYLRYVPPRAGLYREIGISGPQLQSRYVNPFVIGRHHPSGRYDFQSGAFFHSELLYFCLYLISAIIYRVQTNIQSGYGDV